MTDNTIPFTHALQAVAEGKMFLGKRERELCWVSVTSRELAWTVYLNKPRGMGNKNPRRKESISICDILAVDIQEDISWKLKSKSKDKVDQTVREGSRCGLRHKTYDSQGDTELKILDSKAIASISNDGPFDNVDRAKGKSGKYVFKVHRGPQALGAHSKVTIEQPIVENSDDTKDTNLIVPKNPIRYGKLKMHCIDYRANEQLGLVAVAFYGDLKKCQELRDGFRAVVRTREPQRPRRLLVFVNPVSGSSRAKHIYRQCAEPLFRLANIDTQVVVMEHEDHVSDTLSRTDLSRIDGIVGVGGDGTFSTIVNYLLRHNATNNGINVDNPSTSLSSPDVSVGIISAGTGDKLVELIHETRDCRTATIHIIRGYTQPLDVASVHQGQQLLRYSCLLTGYGLYGRMIRAIEERRALGRLRYSVIPLLQLLGRHSFNAKVEFLPAADISESESVSRGSICGSSGSSNAKASCDDQSCWQTIETRVLGVDSFIPRITPLGVSARGYLGDGLAHLTIVKECGVVQHIRHLTNLMRRRPGFYSSYPFIEEHFVRAYRVTANMNNADVRETELMNCDGELLHLNDATFELRVHRGLLKFYTRPEESSVSAASQDGEANPS